MFLIQGNLIRIFGKRNALLELVIERIKINSPLHMDLVQDAKFCKGQFNIYYLESLF